LLLGLFTISLPIPQAIRSQDYLVSNHGFLLYRAYCIRKNLNYETAVRSPIDAYVTNRIVSGLRCGLNHIVVRGNKLFYLTVLEIEAIKSQ